MYTAIRNGASPVNLAGIFAIAIYNRVVSAIEKCWCIASKMKVDGCV